MGYLVLRSNDVLSTFLIVPQPSIFISVFGIVSDTRVWSCKALFFFLFPYLLLTSSRPLRFFGHKVFWGWLGFLVLVSAVCGPYFVPQSDIGTMYTQCPKVLLPCGIKRRQRTDFVERTKTFCRTGLAYPARPQGHHHDVTVHQTAESNSNSDSTVERNQETLDLFPLHPTGSAVQDTTKCSHAHHDCSAMTSTSSAEARDGYNNGDQPFFDFFAANGCFCERD